MLYEDIPLPPEEFLQLAYKIQDPPSAALLTAEQAFSGGSEVPQTMRELYSYTYPVTADTNPPPSTTGYVRKVYATWYKEQREQNYANLCLPSPENQSVHREGSLFTATERNAIKNRALALTDATTNGGALTELLEGTADELKVVRSNIAVRMVGVLAGLAAIPRMLASAHFARQRQTVLEQAYTHDMETLHQRVNNIPWEWPVRDMYAPPSPLSSRDNERQNANNRLVHTSVAAKYFAKVLALTLQHNPDRLTMPITEVNPSELCSPFLVNSLGTLESALRATDHPATRLGEFFEGVPLDKKPPASESDIPQAPPERETVTISPTTTITAKKPVQTKIATGKKPPPKDPDKKEHLVRQPPPQAKEKTDQELIKRYPLGDAIRKGLEKGAAAVVLAQGASKAPLPKREADQHIRLGLLATGYQLHRKYTGKDNLPLFKMAFARDLLYATIGDYAGRIITVRIIIEPVAQALKAKRISTDRQFDDAEVAAYVVVEKRSTGVPASKYDVLPCVVSHSLDKTGRATVSFARYEKLGPQKLAQMIQQFELPERGRRDG